ncbi:MAG: YhcH/YjgK/YiaL family protein [Candidatus Latescibacteria bacterium]|nr:YhcH/YjgK/YiaL family protein [Candidatus Latescibacterota bacterium]
MILDRIDNAERYYPLHPGFKKAFNFMKEIKIETLDDGRYTVDGEKIFILVMRRKGKGIDETKLECHKKYIDIQCTLSGTDLIGWKNLSDCEGSGLGYNDEKDVEFFPGKSSVWVKTPPGTFAVFFPEDVHAPLGSEGDLFKAVIKIKAEIKHKLFDDV